MPFRKGLRLFSQSMASNFTVRRARFQWSPDSAAKRPPGRAASSQKAGTRPTVPADVNPRERGVPQAELPKWGCPNFNWRTLRQAADLVHGRSQEIDLPQLWG